MGAHVGGCRAQPGGLHLGHVYGCFTGLPKDTVLYFAISDVLGSSIVDTSTSLEVARDAISVAAHANLSVQIFRESVIRKLTGSLAERLTYFASYREIAEVHPPREKIKSSSYAGSLNDFLFPIYQAAYLLALRTETACYNDDNSRFVDLARRLARRINSTDQTQFLESLALIRRIPGRLPGWDGARMSKANGNFLSVAASPGQVRRFAERLVGRASAGDDSFDDAGPTQIERMFIELFDGPLSIDQFAWPKGLGRIQDIQTALHRFLSAVNAVRRTDAQVLEILSSQEAQVLRTIREELRQARFLG